MLAVKLAPEKNSSDWNDKIRLIELLLEKNASVNDMDVHRNTPLSLAASKGFQNVDLDIIEILLESGADPNSKAGWEHSYRYANHSLLTTYLHQG